MITYVSYIATWLSGAVIGAVLGVVLHAIVAESRLHAERERLKEHWKDFDNEVAKAIDRMGVTIEGVPCSFEAWQAVHYGR